MPPDPEATDAGIAAAAAVGLVEAAGATAAAAGGADAAWLGVVEAGGGVAPIVTASGALIVALEPSGSVSTTVNDRGPTVRGLLGAQEKAPFAPTVAVQIVAPVASVTFTGSDGWPVPEMVGV